jgi:hypothetical protein
MDKVISDTENLKKLISKSAKTISDYKVKSSVETWLGSYYVLIRDNFKADEKIENAIDYLKTSSTNSRLIRKNWLSNLNLIIKKLKEKKYTTFGLQKNNIGTLRYILQNELLKKIKKVDRKVYILGVELNQNWQTQNCWNTCGILMRIILERALDRKDINIKNKSGLKDKINFCLSSKIFGKSVLESLKKLDNSTKITGDIVAHDSNILLSKNDVELAIIPFRVLLVDIF